MPDARRVFLGWDGPGLPAAARWLLYHRPGLDFSDHLIVVPGARAGRLLQSALVEAVRDLPAGAIGALSPPTIVTPGEVGSAVYRFDTPPAGRVSRRMAWIAALRGAAKSALPVLLRHQPEPGDLLGLARVARMLESWTAEIAAGGKRLEAVAPAGEALTDFADTERWRAAGEIQRDYERILGDLGLHDSDLAFLDALRDPRGSTRIPWTIVLVGVSEVAPLLRTALEREPEVVSLIQAPESEAAAFDALGCINPEHWGSIPIGDLIRADQVIFADTPADQARATLGTIASLGGAFSAEQIVVGVPDHEVVPCLQTAGRRVDARIGEGGGRRRVEFRPAAGRSIAETSPFTLLRGAGEYARGRTFDALAALVRHPDVERWLALRQRDRSEDSRPLRESWLGALDSFASDTLPERVGDGPTGSRSVSGSVVAWLVESIAALLGPVLDDAGRPIGAWAGDIVAILHRIYDGIELHADNPLDQQVVSTCDRLRDAALDLRRAPEFAATAADAIAALLEVLSDSALPAPPAREAIETLGWLELPLDPAPVAIVTGFNEGFVPARPTVEPMLPERLRDVLGLSTSRSRAARDAFLATALLGSRPHVMLIAGRRAAEGDPLLPSRLLFLGDPERAAARLALFTGLDQATPTPRVRERTPSAAQTEQPAMPMVDRALPASLPITAFSLYLRSPYEFYLRYVLRAHAVEDAQPEMSGGHFGTLIHEAMATFAATDAAGSDDARLVRESMADALATTARRRFGRRPRTVVALQIEVARHRLDLLAPLQARRAGEGWRILRAEWRVEPGGGHLDVDGDPIGLHGTIDRIDRHEDGRLAVLDYKTGESQGTPEQVHRAGRAGSKRWIDLQLPLYRHLAAGFVSPTSDQPPMPPVLGYVRIGASEQGIDFADAAWTPADLAAADEQAREIVRSVRARQFQSAGKPSDDRVVQALCRGPDPALAQTDRQVAP